jgi:ferredoxin
MAVTSLLLALIASILLAGWLAFGLALLREGERRAAGIALAAGVFLALPFFAAIALPAVGQALVLGVAVFLFVCGLVLFGLPMRPVDRVGETPQSRIDERDTMFARARLVPGSPEYESYYAARPGYKAGDDKTRALPGLLSQGARAFDPVAFASADASFGLTEALRDAIDGPVASEQVEAGAPAMTDLVKNLARYYGALTVGVAELQPYHVYSHIGRGSGRYGAPVELDHRYAIAFTVEMDPAMVGTAPHGPTVMESARQYVEAARVAVQLANVIRLLGYGARAHIDGNYRVVAPLVARDAGLGEIGRMGLLMTPALGPRVRLGIVTTDLGLAPDGRRPDPSVLDFCRVCQKCATCCPPGAIPAGDRQEIEGALRWRIDSDLCFRYWNVMGTDCARCMAVCPYSHPSGAFHNLIRWGIRRSGTARRAAVRLDDLFYGRVPPPKPSPRWLAAAPSARPLAEGEAGTAKESQQ